MVLRVGARITDRGARSRLEITANRPGCVQGQRGDIRTETWLILLVDTALFLSLDGGLA